MLLTVKNLKVRFKHDGGTVKAVDGIGFEINENEVVGLVGESGSGKTVTALSILKLLPKRGSSVSGEITFSSGGEPGMDLMKIAEREILDIRGSKIAMVFQEPFTSLNPVLRVGEQIDEALLTHAKMPKDEAKNKTIGLLEKVKIADPRRIYNSYPHLLSGGERQRAMIAMAIAMKPRLLIADEPTTAMDVTIQAEILELLLSLKRDLKMSVLFITHDFGIINKVADRFLIMKEGKLLDAESDYAKKLISAGTGASIRAAYGDRCFSVESPHRNTCPHRDIPARSIITVKNLSKSFPVEKGIFERTKESIKAVRGVNLEIKEGKTLGLVGESGSGKTTLGKLLMGLLEADSGEITYGDMSPHTTKPAFRETCPHRTQIVFQDPYSSLDPRMRMRDIVLEGPTIKGAAEKEKEGILRDCLSKVRLDYKDSRKYPHQFSGGQRQRIAIARALAVKARILILDEPVSSLDVIIQSEILGLLKKLQEELNLTYIFISHDLRVVAYMADDVAVMYKGEIVELASRKRIYESPVHPYTKSLLSCAL